MHAAGLKAIGIFGAAVGLLMGAQLATSPVATAAEAVTYLFPARYYVAILQTAFLAGDIWSIIAPNAAVLAGMAIVLFALTRRATRKQLA